MPHAALRQRGYESIPSGKTGRRALNAAHPDDRRAAPPRVQPWLKLAALILVLAALGLPVNDLFRYALLVIATVLVVAGTVAAQLAPWLAALAAVALCVLGQILFPAPRIAEGHNVFLIDDAGDQLSVHSRESGNPESGSPQRGPRDASVAGCPSRGRTDPRLQQRSVLRRTGPIGMVFMLGI